MKKLDQVIDSQVSKCHEVIDDLTAQTRPSRPSRPSNINTPICGIVQTCIYMSILNSLHYGR